MMISPGVWMIFHGEVTASFSGMPDGKQKLLGSSFPFVSMRSLYAASAQGWNGTSLRSAAILIRYLSPGTSQIPPRSGLPSANRGAGAERSALPSFVRGIPGVRRCNHCARAGHGITDRIARAALTPNIGRNRPVFMFPRTRISMYRSVFLLSRSAPPRVVAVQHLQFLEIRNRYRLG